MLKRTIALDGAWQFKQYPQQARRMRDLDDGQWYDCNVPCSIYTALAQAGLIDESLIYRSPEQLDWVSQTAWIFKKDFELPQDFCAAEVAGLILDGLDTVGQVWLNEKLLGKTENMFVGHRFDVNRQLRAGKNTLLIKLSPAGEYAGRLMDRYGMPGKAYLADPRRVYIRKAQYQFGSFIGPALQGCGICRPVRIESFNTAGIDDVHIRTIDCDEHYADVRAAVSIKRSADTAKPLICKIRLHGRECSLSQDVKFVGSQENATAVFRIERPLLWWPIGYGDANLYTLTAELYEQDRLLDGFEDQFGIRSVCLAQNKDEYGRSFEFVINGRPVWAGGCVWTPLTLLAGSQRPQDYIDRMEKLAQANVNMLRVWGGGLYEDDTFYRQADRLGIMVWQDFMFTAAYYPDRHWFVRQAQAEAEAAVRRLRNHPCIVLWCGGDETELLHYEGRLGPGRKFYGKEMYHRILPQLLGELDPYRDYIPTTPFSQSGRKDPNEPDSGDCHLQLDGGDCSAAAYFHRQPKTPRFVAVMGVQSLPAVRTLQHACGPEELFCGDRAMEEHNYQPQGNRRLAAAASELFTPPGSICEYVSQTQLAQARAMKAAVEHLRTQKGINAGALIWTANDCWPAAGYAMLDYFGRPKALYYYARRFFTPALICLLPAEDGRTRGDFLQAGRVLVVNDGPVPITGLLSCRCTALTGEIIDQAQFPVAAGPYSRSGLFQIPGSIAAPPHRQKCLLETLLEGPDGILSQNTFLYLPDKYIQWPPLEIDAEVVQTTANRLTIRLQSKAFIKDLEIIAGAEAQINDTFMDIYPGRRYEVVVDFAGRTMPAVPAAFASTPARCTGVFEPLR